MSGKAVIGQIKNIREHPNADRLNLATCYGNQIVVSKDSYEGEIVVFFDTDIQLSEEFCEQNDLIGRTDPETGERKGGYFDHKRKVRAQKFRGEKSDGFVVPLDYLSYTGFDISKLKIGDEFDELNNHPICCKYVSPRTQSQKSNSRSLKKIVRRLYPMFKEHTDTKQLAYDIDKIPKGAILYISEKKHGSSGRSSNTKIITEPKPWQKRFNRIVFNLFKNREEWKTLSGSRRVVFDTFKKKSYYDDNSFRKKWHDFFEGNLKKGETIYYEIVGWVSENTPIMPRCDNKKTKDKEFIKLYGNETLYKYGCVEGTSDIYVYRITMTNEDGYVVNYSWKAILDRCRELGVKPVVDLCEPFIYDGDKDKLFKLAEDLADGPSVVDQSHIREGVVVRIENGMNYWGLKYKSFLFKLVEGIIKESNEIDIEEAQEFIEEV